MSGERAERESPSLCKHEWRVIPSPVGYVPAEYVFYCVHCLERKHQATFPATRRDD